MIFDYIANAIFRRFKAHVEKTVQRSVHYWKRVETGREEERERGMVAVMVG